ncbi:MAG: phage tail protein [Anaerolineae bacterium]
MPKGRPNEPLTSPRYIVDFPKLKGVFSEVSVASAEFEVISYKFAEKDGKPGYYAAPGQMKPPEITCKRGVTEDDSAWKWAKEVQDGNMSAARSNGTIHLCDYDGTPLLVYNVVQAWPKKVTMPGPKSGSNEVLVEEITLVCEHFERQK